MSNRLFLSNQLDDLIIPNHHKKNSTSSSHQTVVAVPNISSLLSSIQTLRQNAIQSESSSLAAAAASSSSRPFGKKQVRPLQHAGAPPPPTSVTHPVLSFRTGRPMKTNTTVSTASKTVSKSIPTSSIPTRTTDQWYHLRSTPMTSELQMDLTILQNRNYLDPKRFYKSSAFSKQQFPKMVQVGTVVESSGVGGAHSSQDRFTRQEKSQTFLHEVMKDPKIHNYTTQTYRTMQQQHTVKAQQQRQQRRTKSSSFRSNTKKPIFKKAQHRK